MTLHTKAEYLGMLFLKQSSKESWVLLIAYFKSSRVKQIKWIDIFSFKQEKSKSSLKTRVITKDRFILLSLKTELLSINQTVN